MKFFSLRERLDELSWSLTTSDKIKNGAKFVGALAANTVIAAGKLTVAVADKKKEQIERSKKR